MSDIKVRVGQQNAVKVISSISGAASGRAVIADNVIGGIASVRELKVSGISTFIGLSTFQGPIVGNNLFLSGISTFQGTINAQNLSISSIRYLNYNANGVAYFNQVGILTYTESPINAIDYSNYILTTNNSGIPFWTSVIDGGTY